MVDLKTKECTTLISSDQTEMSGGGTVKLNEPGGLFMCYHTQQLYICDTNNHNVLVYNVQNKSLTKVCIINLNLPYFHNILYWYTHPMSLCFLA